MKRLCLLYRYSHLLLITVTVAVRSTSHVSVTLDIFKASVIQGPNVPRRAPGLQSPTCSRRAILQTRAWREHTGVYAHTGSAEQAYALLPVLGHLFPSDEVGAGPGGERCVGSTSRSPDVGRAPRERSDRVSPLLPHPTAMLPRSPRSPEGRRVMTRRPIEGPGSGNVSG